MIASASRLAASPDVAGAGISIPEPSNMGLFALGVAGVIIGRFIWRPKSRDDD